jgi:hypothetical protein
VKGRFALAAAALLLAASCRPPRPALGPVPERLESIQGQASIRSARNGRAGRARLAFFLRLPGRAFLEALDPLNRTIFQVAIEEDEAILLVPSRKAYWSGPRAEVMESGLGFPLSVAEMAGLLGGRWSASSPGETLPDGWELVRDGRGRVTGGRRGDFSFRVEEFFPRRDVPRRIGYASADGDGALTVLRLDFNAESSGPWPALPRIPASYARLTRVEMERLLRDAD